MAIPVNLGECLDAAKEAAQRAAEVLERWRRRFKVAAKGRHDFVTDADFESQRTVREFLLERFPGHEFLGEEASGDGLQGSAKAVPLLRGVPPIWIVDPLDGTTNYVHDCPFYCVSIGLFAAGEPVVGAILDPCRREMFAGALGQGAWLNDRRVMTSPTDLLDNALLATGFPSDMRGHEYTLDWWRHFSLRARSLRRTGSTALNLAYIAAGRFDGYWAFDNKPWDLAAAALLIREAGGLITNTDGSELDLFTPDVVASNGPLHGVLVEQLRGRPGSP